MKEKDMARLRIGILGGTTPQSTIDYYSHIISSYLKKYNDHAYPEIIIYSVRFQNYINWMDSGAWDKIEVDMVKTINKLEKAGANFAIIASNTLHKVFTSVAKLTNIPILSIVDCVSGETKKLSIRRIGLLGTQFTMTDSFFHDRLARDGIECIVPDGPDLKTVHDIIFKELSYRVILSESREKFITIVSKLESNGARGVILGCTEIPLLISQDDVNIHVLDSTAIHAEAALRKSLSIT